MMCGKHAVYAVGHLKFVLTMAQNTIDLFTLRGAYMDDRGEIRKQFTSFLLPFSLHVRKWLTFFAIRSGLYCAFG